MTSIFQVSGDAPNSKNNQAYSGVANINVGDVVPGGKEGESAPVKEEVTPQGENPTIVLDGPLGRAYTQALNLVYAKEDTGTMALIIDAQTRAQDTVMKPKGHEQKGVYVYAANGETLTAQGCLEASKWMEAHHDKGEIMISLECFRNPSKHTGLVEEMAKSMGVKVYYSKESVVNDIKRKISVKK